MAVLFPVGFEAKISASCQPKILGRTKHREVRVLKTMDALRDGRLFSPLPVEPPLRMLPSVQQQQQQQEMVDDKQKYYVNMGYAIRTLREEFPMIFYREPTFEIYRDDIVFKNPLNTFTGIENYRRLLWALRFHGQMFFKALWVDIISIWQPEENVIMIRWVVHGVPRMLWENQARFDGTSQYKLDSGGKIFELQVDNAAINSPPKHRVSAVQELIQALACPSTPNPTYFETATPSLPPRVLSARIGVLAKCPLAKSPHSFSGSVYLFDRPEHIRYPAPWSM